MTDRLISVILPVHNQADHLREIVERYAVALQRLQHPYELLLVENGSRDASLSICHALEERYPQVRVLHSQKGGWGRAVKLGLREATGDLLCYTNSARTTPRELMLVLVYATVYEDVIVKANRKIREGARRQMLTSVQHRVSLSVRPRELGHQRDAEGVSANVRQTAHLELRRRSH